MSKMWNAYRAKERLPYNRPKVATVQDVPVAVAKQATRKMFIPRPLSGTSQQAMRTGGWADPIRGGELKFIDVSNTTNCSISAVTFSAGVFLNGLVQGSDATQRVGRKVNLKSLYMRYSFQLSPTSTQGCVGRILVVYDKQTNATAPAITDILLADAFASPNNLSNRDRFVTLVDVLTSPIGVQGEFAACDVIYRKINLEQMFNTGSTGNIGDVTSGGIYAFFSQSGGVGVAAPQIVFRSRIKFTDV